MNNIFDRYNDAVRALWVQGGLDVEANLSKRTAIRLDLAPKHGLITATQIEALYNAMESDDCWKRKNPGSNWKWRTETPAASSERTYRHDEVQLERRIAALNPKVWTCQMSTSSGVQGKFHYRRAIDLVRRNGDNRFAFIELKLSSDNPLYAAFEILSYALAYLHARVSQWKGAGAYDVMAAQAIELTVLGPSYWYKFHERGKPERTFNYDWLAKDIATALNTFVREELRLSNLQFEFAFRSFKDPDATEIDRLARNKWWSDSTQNECAMADR